MATLQVEPRTRALAETVLIVEDDPYVSRFFSDRLRTEGLFVVQSPSVEDARQHIRRMLSDGINCIVVLLDLMFERNDPSEGIEMLDWLETLVVSDRDRVQVVVRTNAVDADTRRRALNAGARAFHVKSRDADRERAIQDVLTYTGRDGLVSSMLLEIVDVVPEQQALEVRYRTTEDVAVRTRLDLDIVSRDACIPGGSFWLDTFRRFEKGQMVYSNRARLIDLDDDPVLAKYLGEAD